MIDVPAGRHGAGALPVAVLFRALVYRFMLARARRAPAPARITPARAVRAIAMPTAAAGSMACDGEHPVPWPWPGRMHAFGSAACGARRGGRCARSAAWRLGVLLRPPVDGDDHLHARRIHPQAPLPGRSWQVVVILMGGAPVLRTLPVSATPLASAGIVGVVAGRRCGDAHALTHGRPGPCVP